MAARFFPGRFLHVCIRSTPRNALIAEVSKSMTGSPRIRILSHFGAALLAVLAMISCGKSKTTNPPPPGPRAAACSLAVGALDFGTVVVGSSADRSLQVFNVGGQPLAGSLTTSCPAFTVTGSSSVSIPAGQSQSFNVRFSPSSAGAAACSLIAGSCHIPLTGNAVDPPPPPHCVVHPASLDFGIVVIGQSADRTLTVTNDGGGNLPGNVSAGCSGFVIVGNPVFNLGAGQSATFTVRFIPSSSAAPARSRVGRATPLGSRAQSCTIQTGSSGCSVSAIGVAQAPTSCLIAPTSLDFGTVLLNQTADRTFSVTNTGGGSLSGIVRSACGGFGLVGDSAYSLAASESKTFTVRFAPTGLGPQNCNLDPGTGCGTVGLIGSGDELPGCAQPLALDFGSVVVGSSVDRTLAVTNGGGGTLTGTVSSPCPQFAVVGNASYSLSRGQSAGITVRFTPSGGGLQTCLVNAGGLCGATSASGIGQLPPACQVSPPSLGFGVATLGTTVDRTFSVKNVGGGTLSGSVSESCTDFSLVGASSYSLAGGDSAVFTVRFSPTQAVVRTCNVSVGPGCSSVSLSGTGQLAAACLENPASLDFGTVNLGTAASRTFTITNTGGATLAGKVTSPCPVYTVQGTGLYSLPAGQAATFKVFFSPLGTGAQPCTLQTGNTACTGIPVTGAGHRPPETAYVTISMDAAGHANFTSNFLASLQFGYTNVVADARGCGMAFRFHPDGTGKAELRIQQPGFSGINVDPSCSSIQVNVATFSQDLANPAKFESEIGTCVNTLGFIPTAFCGNSTSLSTASCFTTGGATKCALLYTDFSAANYLTANTITFSFDGWILTFPKGRPPFTGTVQAPRPARPTWKGVSQRPIRR